jgi:hypothetical protein
MWLDRDGCPVKKAIVSGSTGVTGRLSLIAGVIF